MKAVKLYIKTFSLDSENIIKNTPKFQSNMEPEIRNESQAFAHRKMNFIEM